jgi:hypothetical protein
MVVVVDELVAVGLVVVVVVDDGVGVLVVVDVVEGVRVVTVVVGPNFVVLVVADVIAVEVVVPEPPHPVNRLLKIMMKTKHTMSIFFIILSFPCTGVLRSILQYKSRTRQHKSSPTLPGHHLGSKAEKSGKGCWAFFCAYCLSFLALRAAAALAFLASAAALYAAICAGDGPPCVLSTMGMPIRFSALT